MIKNYLKVALRNIKRHKGFSIINIAGLAIGLACCLLITIWVLDELSYDKFHENAANLYRVEENQHYSGRIFYVYVTPYPLGPALKTEIADIIDATRVVWTGGVLFKYEDNTFFEDNGRAVDPSFLKMFTYPLVKGDKNTALDSPFSAVLSEDLAEKYFGDDDPIGKVITLNNKYDFTVTGVMENIPHNTYLQFDFLVPYEILKRTGQTQEEDFGSNSIFTFVQLADGIAAEQVNQQISGFIKTKLPESRTELRLMPFVKLHLHEFFGYEKGAGAIQYVYIFSVIAFIVLLIACINFMNLSTARSANRAKEVGLRKVVGAVKGHLVRQFYGESVVYAFIALIFAVGIVTILLPAFSRLSSKELSWGVAGIETILLGLLGITLFTGLVAGSYPAMFLSAFQPARVLKGSLFSGSGGSLFRRTLVVIQFALSILLIIGTAVVYQQQSYIKNMRLGWDKEHLVYIPLRADTRKSYNALKQELVQIPQVLNVTGTSQLPTHIGSNSAGAQWEGKDPEFSILIGFNSVDYDFTETLKIEMAEGRSFDKEYISDQSQAWIVNEEVAKLMDKDSIIGERFSHVGKNGTIVGVMKNFHYQTLKNEIEPLAIAVNPDDLNYMIARIPPEEVSTSLGLIENTWKRVIPTYPFEYRFMDERYDRMYRTEQRIGTLLRYFAILAVFVACLGLFGLASFMAEKRTKEIGIRKVLGASIAQITRLLCKEFFLLVIVANIIAWPAAYFVMKKWLQSYAYRAELGIFVFFGAMLLALLVAILSVGYQAVRAARANPSDSLRYE
ncbi:MAG: ABC transporter permease [Candidatus Aminicenantes bacterium]|nr:MAG: ABC transporter permease [Candidatus Aminicenantes bacterium]